MSSGGVPSASHTPARFALARRSRSPPVYGASRIREGPIEGIGVRQRRDARARRFHGVLDKRPSTPILKNMLNHEAPPLDRVFHALADPTRLSLVERLTRRPRSVSELAEPLEMSLPGVLQHLRVLESTGVVRSRKAGRVRTFYLEAGTLRELEQWLRERRSVWEQRLDRLGTYLEESAPPKEEA